MAPYISDKKRVISSEQYVVVIDQASALDVEMLSRVLYFVNM